MTILKKPEPHECFKPAIHLCRLSNHFAFQVLTIFLLLMPTTIVWAANSKTNSSTDSVDAIFAKYNQPDAPGCALAVMRDGKIIYERGYGLANLEHKMPIVPSKTVFNIASASKQFTAASVLLLVRDNKLSLDDDVRKFIPELPDYGHTISLRNLLHHTSGLRDFYTLLELAFVSSVDSTTEVQTMAMITRQRALDFKPGSTWAYSSTNYFLLGQIVQRVSGKALREFANEHIFLPLGMHHTQFLTGYDQVIPNLATAYQPLICGGYVVDMSNWLTVGPSGLRTTVDDLSKWDNNFYTGKVGGLWLSEQLQMRGQLNDGAFIDYGRGLISDRYRGLESVSHSGSFAGYRAELIRFAREKFSVAVLCNTGNSSPEELARKVADIYLADKFQELKSTPLSDAKLKKDLSILNFNPKRFIGTYWNQKKGSVRRIEMRGEKLFYVFNAGNATELVVESEQRLRSKNLQQEMELTFGLDTKGQRTMHVNNIGVGIIQGGTAELLEVQPFDVAGDQLKIYAGKFHSAELLTDWQLIALGGKLVLRDPRGVETPLLPAFKDTLWLDDALIRFERDATGNIVGFFVDAGRAFNIKFAKVHSVLIE